MCKIHSRSRWSFSILFGKELNDFKKNRQSLHLFLFFPPPPLPKKTQKQKNARTHTQSVLTRGKKLSKLTYAHQAETLFCIDCIYIFIYITIVPCNTSESMAFGFKTTGLRTF